MKTTRVEMSGRWRCAVALAAACMVVQHHPLLAAGTAWQIDRGDVRITCPLTIGGSFEARTSSLSGTVTAAGSRPATLNGEIAVDLTTLDTGIELRNTHLRTKYLEVDKGADFNRAVLTEIKLTADDVEAFQGKTTFTATFLLHGTRKPVAGQAEIRKQGPSLHVDASFPVTIADYGIPKPQYLGVGVKNQVQIKVSFVATPAASTTAAR